MKNGMGEKRAETKLLNIKYVLDKKRKREEREREGENIVCPKHWPNCN